MKAFVKKIFHFQKEMYWLTFQISEMYWTFPLVISILLESLSNSKISKKFALVSRLS